MPMAISTALNKHMLTAWQAFKKVPSPKKKAAKGGKLHTFTHRLLTHICQKQSPTERGELGRDHLAIE